MNLFETVLRQEAYIFPKKEGEERKRLGLSYSCTRRGGRSFPSRCAYVENRNVGSRPSLRDSRGKG